MLQKILLSNSDSQTENQSNISQKSGDNGLFSKISTTISNDLKKVDEIIIANSSGSSQLISDIVCHLVLSGGKRIRPILTILSSKLCGYKSNIRTANLAAAIELIHTATLLHDDVIDDSNLRRGQKTSNAIWGNKASILVGDYLLSIAFGLMVKDGSLLVLELLSSSSAIMADGEIKQLSSCNNIETSEEKYLEIIFAKTAILFSAAMQIGGLIVDEKNLDQQKHLAEFGKNLGMAFQIVDDVLDYSSEEQVLGKEIGNDFFEGKITLPLIITYQNSNQDEKKYLKEIFSKNLFTKEKDQKLLQEILILINKYNALEIAKQKAEEYKIAARNALNYFADSKEKQMLLEILDYSTTRKY